MAHERSAAAAAQLGAEVEGAPAVTGVEPDHLVRAGRVGQRPGIEREAWGRDGDGNDVGAAHRLPDVGRQRGDVSESLHGAGDRDATGPADLVEPL